MRWLILVFVILLAFFLGLLAAGAMLPENHTASRTLQTKQAPQAVWDAINDHENEPKWRSDVENVTRQPDRNGQAVWLEKYKDGNTVGLMTTEFKPPNRIVREIADVDGPFSGRWEIDIQPTSTGSSVKVTEIGKVTNPFFRFVSRFVIGHTTYMEKYLTNLAAKFGEKAEFPK